MKITTWNVNGIRAILGKGMMNWVRSAQPEVLCLQEIKARPDQLGTSSEEFNAYNCTWNPAVRPGYSGVATLTQSQPDEVQIGIGDTRFDVEGRVIRTKHTDFYLYNVYFPNGKRDQGRVDYKLDFYRSLLDACDNLHSSGEKIVITGDFNTAHKEIDLAHPKQNRETSGFLPEERVWIDYYLEHGFVDAFRWFYPDRVQYTWWTYIGNARERNVGWRLDYFLVSESLLPLIQDVIIHDEVKGSDHCPVSIIINDSGL
jgi:exodeoxyribonuclease III